MSLRRVTTYACLALAAGWGLFPSSAHACGLFRWLWGDNDATTAYYAPYASYMPGACGTGYAAQRPVVSWMPVTNYATTVQSVPVTSYRPSLFGGGLFGCNWHANQAARVPVTSYMPAAAPAACCAPSLPVETVYSQPAHCCPTTTSYSPPVTTYALPSSSCSSCSSCPTTTTYSVPTTTTLAPSTGSCSCGCHSSTSAIVGTGVLAGSSSSTYAGVGSSYANSGTSGAAVVADTPPALGATESVQVDGNSLGLPETSYSANYGGSSLSLSAPAVRVDSTVAPGPIRSETGAQFGVPTVRPLDSSSLPSNVHSAAAQPMQDSSAFGVAPMRDPETRDRDGRLLAPPLLDPRAKTAEAPQANVPTAIAFDDRIPVLPASLTVETPAAFVPASASSAASATAAIETTGLRLIDDAPARPAAPVAYRAAKVAVDYPASNAGFAPASATGSNVTQLSENVWQSARP